MRLHVCRPSSGDASGCTQLLAEIIQKVYKQKIAADPNANLTIKDFIDQASNFLPRAQIQNEVDNYMLKGNPIDLRRIKFTGYFKFDYQGEVPLLSLVQGTNLKEFCKW